MGKQSAEQGTTERHRIKMNYKEEVIQNFTEAVIILHERVLGKGNFGEVKEGLLNGKKVAVKIPHNLTRKVIEENKRELNIMTQLSHRNIVKLLGIIDGGFNKEPKLVFEYVENGSLSNYVSAEYRDKNTLVRLCYDIICGMAYLHSKKYIHRDLAARNVLVDAMHRAKVADFGLSRLIDVENHPENCYYFVDGNKPLPVRWSPKETIEAVVSLGAAEGKFSFPSDVWSFGVTMWEIWSGGSTPYKRNGNVIPSSLVIDYIHDGKNPNSFDKPEDAPDEILSVMEEIFQVERKKRPTFLQLQEKFENIYYLEMLTSDSPLLETENQSNMETEIKHLSVVYTETTWWPSQKMLVKALQPRKIGNRLIIEKIHEMIISNRRNMTVICQSEPSSKFSGFVGVGKSLTAKWYAHHYEKQYQRIIWIDSGQGNLLKSLKFLARDMGITDRNELQDLARGCYENLSKLKCLWIFDNVESYMGNDGIHSVLPLSYPQFYCLITSRSRENWGKDNGYGEISKFEMDVFDQSETMDFFKTHLNPQIPFTDYQLRQLSDLLGNLPLALQLALSAVNFRKVDLQHYIDQIFTAFDFNIVSEKFDDYEMTISKCVQIALDQLQKEPKGKVAYKIFTIFGYIRPHEIQFDFLRNISGVNTNDLHASIETLLKYSLITKSGKEKCISPYTVLDKLFRRIKVEVERDVFAINPLLQQVIRHNEKKTENETIRRILNYKGYLDYKMMPYLHASDALKSDFKDIRTKFIDQNYLQTFLTAKKFQDALELSRFIHLEIRNFASSFNYGICLDLQGEEHEALKIFKEMQENPKSVTNEEIIFHPGLIPLNSKPSKLHIQFALLCQSFRTKRIRSEIREKDPPDDSVKLSLDFRDLKGIVQSLESCCINCYSLECIGSQITLEVHSDVGKPQMKKMLFTACSIQKDIEFPKHLKRLSLSNVKFTGENNEEVKYDLSHLMMKTSNIEQLYVTDSELSLCWNSFVTMSHVDVRNGKITLPPNPYLIYPKILRLEDVEIFQDAKKLKMANLNDLVAFTKIQKLHLSAGDDCTQFSIDMKYPLTAKEVSLLDNTVVIDWKSAMWNIHKLILRNVSFVGKNQMKITEMETNSPVDVSCIPKTIRRIKMDEGTSFSDSSGDLSELPLLKFLHFCDIPYPSSTLSLFLICRNLVKLKFQLQLTFTIRVDLTSIPESVEEIEIIANYNVASIDIVGREERQLNTLIVDNLEQKSICDILEKLKPNKLVIHSNKSENEINALMSLVKSHYIPTVLISANRKDYRQWIDSDFLV